MLKVMIGENSLKDVKLTDDMIVCPDAQMHPYEQYEYAKEIVQKAKVENITIVTFSAVFIHALDILGKFFQVKVDFYLWSGGDSYLMNETMNGLYRNLGELYELIQHIDINIEFGLDDDHTIEEVEKEYVEWNNNNY